MNDDAELPGEPDEEDEEATSDQGDSAERGPVVRWSVSFLDDFAAIQRSLASIDFSALNRAVLSSAALEEWARTSVEFNESLRKQTEFFARIPEGIAFKLPAIDISGLLAALNKWIPVNLRDVVALDVVATVALDEGIPLSWVPRTDIVVLLIEADGPGARVGILTITARTSLMTARRRSLRSSTNGPCSAAVPSLRCVPTSMDRHSLMRRTSSTASCSDSTARTAVSTPSRGRRRSLTNSHCSLRPRISRSGRCFVPLPPGFRTLASNRRTTSLVTPPRTPSATPGSLRRSPHSSR